MKVTSPIGELPFVVRGVSLHDGHVVVEGELGTWRSRIEVGAGDHAYPISMPKPISRATVRTPTSS